MAPGLRKPLPSLVHDAMKPQVVLLILLFRARRKKLTINKVTESKN